MPKAGLRFSKKDEWYTPKGVVDFFGSFDYDPCTTKERAKYLGIPKYDTHETDGLKADWGKYRRVWVNPPFTRKFEFLGEAIETVRRTQTTMVFVLLPIEALTTKRFHSIVGYQPYRMWVPDGRIKFEGYSGGESSPAFGSVVLEFNSALTEQDIVHWRLNGSTN